MKMKLLLAFLINISLIHALPTQTRNLIHLDQALTYFHKQKRSQDQRPRLAVHDVSFFGHKIILKDELILSRPPAPLNLISPHGVSVAQIIVDPLYGTNPGQKIHSLTRGIFEEEIENAVDHWIDEGIKIVNLSMSFRSQEVVDSLNRFIEAGGIIISSSGNSAERLGIDLAPHYQNFKGLTISASDNKGHLESFSQYDQKSLLAPGSIQSLPVHRLKYRSSQSLREEPETLSEDLEVVEYGFGMTSGAAPIVTGVVTMALTLKPHLKQREINQLLLESASLIDGKPVLNAYAFLKKL